jgi:hypothetical protein
MSEHTLPVVGAAADRAALHGLSAAIDDAMASGSGGGGGQHVFLCEKKAPLRELF